MYNKCLKTYIPNPLNGEIIMPVKDKKQMQQITIKLKVDDLNHLKEYADRKGGNPVSHYIREAVSEYLENHY